LREWVPRTRTALPVPISIALSSMLLASELPAGFLDFSGLEAQASWLHDGLSLRAMGHVDVRGDWTTSLDGIYFIREAITVRTPI